MKKTSRLIRVTAKQRTNALDALNNMWPSIPPENVAERLGTWRTGAGYALRDSPPTCNTIACFGGWCAWWPAFRAQGVFVSAEGAPTIVDNRRSAFPVRRSPVYVAQHLFGHQGMFHPRGFLPTDTPSRHVSDHETVRMRLLWLIANSTVIDEVKA